VRKIGEKTKDIHPGQLRSTLRATDWLKDREFQLRLSVLSDEMLVAHNRVDFEKA
jgi:hypothetical protein